MKKYKKTQSNNVLKRIKVNDELKCVKVNVVTNIIKDEIEHFSDVEAYTDDDEFKEGRVIGFR